MYVILSTESINYLEELNMKVIVLDNAAQIGEEVGKIFVNQVNNKPDSVLGLATGMSPVPTYDYMAKEYAAGNVSFKNVTTFNLDEYCDLPKSDKNSFYSFMVDNLFSRTDIDLNKVNFIDGNAEEKTECERYENAIENAGGIDLQLLGIGTNGHIGFNEPADEFTQRTYKVKLTDSTIASNQKFFGDVPMPRYAMTMGIGSIMKAKKIVLIATGESKAKAAYAMIKGEVSPSCPASVLQNHEDAVIFLDKEAAKLL